MTISKFNHNTNKFNAKAEKGTPYYSLKDLFTQKGSEAVYRISALYINERGKYGKQPLAYVTCTDRQESIFINLPSHLLDDVTEMINDNDVVDQINRGEAGMKIRSYINRNGGESYSVEWMDLEQLPF